ncbi:MAG: dipeptidase [Cyclobacteriaceae bacterium]
MKTTIQLLFITLLSSMIFSCSTGNKSSEEKSSPSELRLEKAKKLAEQFIITDGHIDLPYMLADMGYLDLKNTPDLVNGIAGEFDVPRAKSGGLDAPFMSIFIPASLQKSGGSKAMADSLIDLVNLINSSFPDHFAPASSPKDVQNNFQKGLISLPMGMENGSPIETLEDVKYFYDRGIRYITLTHGKVNQICDSSYDPERKWNGLSPFGKEVVLEMNRQGIMVDVSHISDSAFYQVMQISEVPCIASHSSVRKFTPGFERNMSDDMIKLLAEKGGVIQINFGSTFISQRSKDLWAKMKVARKAYSEKMNLKESDSIVKIFEAVWLEKNNVFSNVKKVVDHIDHVVNLVGIDHVGLGSDFDGVGNSLPEGLKDVKDIPNLIDELLARNYSEEDLEKICSKNVFRVWNAVLDHAGKNE